jgi:hypothetical protein
MKRLIEIFFSYAHEDEELMNDVRRQLIVEERNGRILKWHDREIPAGTDWRQQIDSRLKRAKIILLFMSPHFIESRYCYEVEGKVALSRHETGDARVIPVILRPCLWERTPFGKLQALPRDAKPISRWSDRDEACMNVAEGVMAVVDELLASRDPAQVALLQEMREDLREHPTTVRSFVSNLNKLLKDKTFSSPAMAFISKVRISPPFLGISHTEPVLLPEHEKELTEYFQAIEFMAKNKDSIKGGNAYQCREEENEKDVAQKEYGNEKFAGQILNANPGGFPFSTGQMINLPRIDVSEKLGVSTGQLDVFYSISQGQRVRKTLDFLLNDLHLQHDEALPLVHAVYIAAQNTSRKKAF